MNHISCLDSIIPTIFETLQMEGIEGKFLVLSSEAFGELDIVLGFERSKPVEGLSEFVKDLKKKMEESLYDGVIPINMPGGKDEIADYWATRELKINGFNEEKTVECITIPKNEYKIYGLNH